MPETKAFEWPVDAEDVRRAGRTYRDKRIGINVIPTGRVVGETFEVTTEPLTCEGSPFATRGAFSFRLVDWVGLSHLATASHHTDAHVKEQVKMFGYCLLKKGEPIG